MPAAGVDGGWRALLWSGTSLGGTFCTQQQTQVKSNKPITTCIFYMLATWHVCFMFYFAFKKYVFHVLCIQPFMFTST